MFAISSPSWKRAGCPDRPRRCHPTEICAESRRSGLSRRPGLGRLGAFPPTRMAGIVASACFLFSRPIKQEIAWPVVVVVRVAAKWGARSVGCAAGFATGRSRIGAAPPNATRRGPVRRGPHSVDRFTHHQAPALSAPKARGLFSCQVRNLNANSPTPPR